MSVVCYYQKYVENVKQDTNIGTNILRVSASDEDADNNGAIVYNLTAYNSQDLEYFTILPESGWIVLIKPLDVSVQKLPFSNFPLFFERHDEKNISMLIFFFFFLKKKPIIKHYYTTHYIYMLTIDSLGTTK